MINGMRAAQARYVQENAEIFLVAASNHSAPEFAHKFAQQSVHNLINRHGNFHEALSCVQLADCARV
jgi:hypothetical protein